MTQPDRPVREGGLTPRLGCSTDAHHYLGWCCGCPGITMVAELGGWRTWATGAGAPDVAWARTVSQG